MTPSVPVDVIHHPWELEGTSVTLVHQVNRVNLDNWCAATAKRAPMLAMRAHPHVSDARQAIFQKKMAAANALRVLLERLRVNWAAI